MASIRHSEPVDSISKANPLLFHALRLNAIATVIASILYGFLAMLFVNCVTLLLRSKCLCSTERMRKFFILYVTSMMLLSTGAMIQEIIILDRIFWDVIGYKSFRVTFSNLIPVTTPFITWGADGLLMWRCLILYDGTSWICNLGLKVTLVALSLSSFAAGIMYFLADNIQNPAMTLIFTFLTPAVNMILVILLAARMLYQQAQISKLLGPEMKRISPYTRIATMCTESCALIIVVGVAGIVTTFPGHGIWSVFPIFILPHICVISPLLIVYRVGQGRSLEAITRSGLSHKQSMGPLEFALGRESTHSHVKEGLE